MVTMPDFQALEDGWPADVTDLGVRRVKGARMQQCITLHFYRGHFSEHCRRASLNLSHPGGGWSASDTSSTNWQAIETRVETCFRIGSLECTGGPVRLSFCAPRCR